MSTSPLASRADARRTPAAEDARAQGFGHAGHLELSRRVDWRFLLPQLRVARVACVGRADPPLQSALPLVGETVHFFDDGTAAAEFEGSFDLVVVRGAKHALLRRAAQLVRPGGGLYLEIERPLLRPDLWRHTPAGMARRVARLGFANVAAHWHWPSHARCTSILPLDDGGTAVRHFVEHQGSSTAQRIKKRAGRLVLSLGLVNCVVGSFSIVGEKAAS